jgi:hypothetical protein
MTCTGELRVFVDVENIPGPDAERVLVARST